MGAKKHEQSELQNKNILLNKGQEIYDELQQIHDYCYGSGHQKPLSSQYPRDFI